MENEKEVNQMEQNNLYDNEGLTASKKIMDWIDKVIEGPSGFKVWEEREWVIFHTSRECGIAAFIIRALANPNCHGSEEVLKHIAQRRIELLQHTGASQRTLNQGTAAD